MLKRLIPALVAGLLSIAPAAAQQANDLPVVPLGYCQLTGVTNSAAVALSSCAGGIPARASRVAIVVETQAVRYRDDGTAPTATVGFPITTTQGAVTYYGPVSSLQFIAQTTGATIDVLFYR